MSTALSSMQVYYAARAAEYDKIYLKPERQSDLRAIERWIAPLFSGAELIEIACGTGYWTRIIAATAARVVAIDSSPETMEIARLRLPAGKVEFVAADAYALPASLGRFSAAFAGFWFSHVPKSRRGEFLLGLTALLAPGARVLLLDNLYLEGSSTALSERDAEGNTYQRRQLEDGSTHRVLKNFPTETELLSLGADHGVNGRFTRWQYYWAFEFETP